MKSYSKIFLIFLTAIKNSRKVIIKANNINPVIILLFFIVQSSVYCQNDLSKFSGTIVLKETEYHKFLDRRTTDEYINYYEYNVRNEIKITHEMADLYPDMDDKSYNMFHVKKINDSIFLYFYNRLNNQYDSILQYSLNKNDTIYGSQSYFLDFRYDTLYFPETNTKQIALERKFKEDYNYNNVYVGDKKIKFKDYKMDCYVISKTYQGHRFGPKVLIKQYIDKNLLIPVYEIEYTKFTGNRFKMAGIHTNKWIVTREMKIIIID